MGTYIINLMPFGDAFFNSVIHYCQATGNPSTPERHREIYSQCLSQLCNKLHPDANEFMMNLMELPDWRVIHYLDTPIDHQTCEFFKDAFRAFGICFWKEVQAKVTINETHAYILDSCSPIIAVIGDYVDAGLC